MHTVVFTVCAGALAAMHLCCGNEELTVTAQSTWAQKQCADLDVLHERCLRKAQMRAARGTDAVSEDWSLTSSLYSSMPLLAATLPASELRPLCLLRLLLLRLLAEAHMYCRSRPLCRWRRQSSRMASTTAASTAMPA